MIIKLLNCKNTETIQKGFNIYKPFVFQCYHFGTANPPLPLTHTHTLKMFIKILLAEFFLNCKLVHTSRSNQQTDELFTLGLVERFKNSNFILESKMAELNQNKKLQQLGWPDSL